MPQDTRHVVAITVAGNLDEPTVQRVSSRLRDVDRRHDAAIVDLEAIARIDWSALCRLCALVDTLQATGDVRLRARQPRVRRLIETLRTA